jgi:HK97 family phage portal protein
MSQPDWYNKERVSQSGSVILNNWKAEREQQRGIQNASSENMQLSEGRSGSELYGLLTGGMVAGVSLTERTAMSISAVYACVGLIGGSVASLPLPIYKRTLNGKERVQHEIYTLLNQQPHPAWAAATAWEFALSSVLLSGDSFMRIHRASRFSPKIAAFEPLNPALVEVIRDGMRRVYLVTLDDGKRIAVDQDDMLHVPGLGFDGLRGMSPVRFAALRMAGGLAKAADEYSASFFQNGARPDFVLQTDAAKLSTEAADVLRETWMSKHQGVQRAHLPAVLTGGLKVQPLTLPAKDAQLIETRRFQVEDVCRVFGVPPHMIGHTEKTTSWGSGVEAQAIGFVKFTLQRWLVKFEQEINRKCFADGALFTEFSTSGLERGDIKTRNESYRTSIGRAGEPGWMTVNEVRRAENLPPIEGGDKLNDGGKNASNTAPTGSK